MTFANRLTKPAPKVKLEADWKPETYFIVFTDDNEISFFEWCDTEEELLAGNELGSEDFYRYEKFTTNKEHFFRGYFYYNDQDSYEDTDKHWSDDFISEEHLDAHWDSSNGDGHLQLVKIEEWKDGHLKSAKLVSEDDHEYLDVPRVIYP